jgi:hypothetical protein
MFKKSIISLMHHRHELLDISKYPLETLTGLLHKIWLLAQEAGFDFWRPRDRLIRKWDYFVTQSVWPF